MGGYWINEGLPQHVAIERKPENVCEIQKSTNGYVGVMLQLKIVKKEEEKKNTEEDYSRIPHGAKMLLELMKPWFKKGDILVFQTATLIL